MFSPNLALRYDWLSRVAFLWGTTNWYSSLTTNCLFVDHNTMFFVANYQDKGTSGCFMVLGSDFFNGGRMLPRI